MKVLYENKYGEGLVDIDSCLSKYGSIQFDIKAEDNEYSLLFITKDFTIILAVAKSTEDIERIKEDLYYKLDTANVIRLQERK